MSRLCHATAYSLSILVAMAAPALGQVDHRVNQGNSNTGGYALDKNTQLGSGGYNLSRPGYEYGASSNAIITGNVTGLGGFKGYSPIQQTNQFRADLPSSGLSGFQARGVGLPELNSGRVPTQTYFYDPNRTISDVGMIRQGLNAPGSSRPNFPRSNQAIDPSSPNRMPLPNLRDPGDQRVQFNSAPTIGTPGQVTLKPLQPVQLENVAPAYRAAAGSSIFGAAVPEVSQTLPSGLNVDSRLDQIQVGQTWSELNLTEAEKKLKESLPPDNGTLATSGFKDFPQAGGPISNKPVDTTALARPDVAPLPMNGQAPSNLGEDRFADMYNAVRAANQAGVTQLGFEPKPAEPGSAAAMPGADPKRRVPESIKRKVSDGAEQLAVAAKWAKDVLDDPLTTFAGKNQSALNRYLADGEEAMHKGEYYKASRLFEMARTVDPFNPLPLLDRGHALAAAGDYVSAVASLEQGLRRFPHIAAFNVDLVALVGDRDVFDVRRADLENRLAGRDQYDLRFLLGYLEWYSGLRDEGLRNLRQAARLAPDDSPIKTFADLVAGEKSLPALQR